jgi:hypothetical protein
MHIWNVDAVLGALLTADPGFKTLALGGDTGGSARRHARKLCRLKYRHCSSGL